MRQFVKRFGLPVLAMIFVIVFVLLSIDGSAVYADRRNVQNAADKAAFGAALAKANGRDYSSVAYGLAANNGFNNNGTTNSVQVYNPPIIGPYTGSENYIQIIITSRVSSGIFRIKEENTVSSVAYSPPPCYECPPPEILLVNGSGPVVTSTPNSGGGLVTEFARVDEILKQSMGASLAYNKPETMSLDETVTIELLLSPSVSPNQLGEQVTGAGSVATGVVEITPRMTAYLYTHDSSALIVQPLQDSPEQLVGESSTTKWSWSVKAVEGGIHTLTLKIFRLVKYDGKDYWREVNAYQSDIEVKVSLGQKLRALDWKWVFPTIATALLIPALWRWYDDQKKNDKSQIEEKNLKRQNQSAGSQKTMKK